VRFRTVKIKLDNNRLQSFGAYITCCGKRKWFGVDEFDPGDIFYCLNCGRPLVLMTDDGRMFYAGNSVFPYGEGKG
jgi:hypothetical protein